MNRRHRERSDAIQSRGKPARTAVERGADEKRLPFEAKVPNPSSRAAIAELEAGENQRFATVADMIASLHDENN